jgi:ABC-type antimicrobial peptide transport system permease subunit
VVVVSERLARLLWPNETAIGRRLRLGADSMPFSEVVGVVKDLVTYRLAEAEEAQYWVPAAQIGWSASDLVVRVDGGADAAAERIMAALRGWRSDYAALTVTPIRRKIDAQMRPWRLGASVFAGFGAIALVLAAMGVFGVVSFAVAQRTPEFGIRAALGASRARLAGMVVGDTLRLALPGLAVGILISLAASRWLDGLLFNTSARDLTSIVGAAALLLVAALAAALAPARRATTVDPAIALRAE